MSSAPSVPTRGVASRALSIDGRLIDDSSDCYVIAEVGSNHGGSLERCMQMFAAAKACGADAVKLQKREVDTLYTPAELARPYTGPHSYGATYGEHRRRLEFTRTDYAVLQDCARELGITFFATAFDTPSVDTLASLDMPAYKIASGDLTNTPLLRYVAELGRPIILSTGGGTLDDVRRAAAAVLETNDQLALLQCTASYPPRWEELDLRVIPSYRDAFPDTVIGFSSHDPGAAASIAAFALGARVIEKHFTLDRTLPGSDHAFSLEPVALSGLVTELRQVREALGSPAKRRHPSERPALHKMGKKLVVRRDLEPGERLSAEDLASQSPGDGLAPYHLERLVGQRVTRRLRAGEAVTFDAFSVCAPSRSAARR